jgi:hypothetical protein
VDQQPPQRRRHPRLRAPPGALVGAGAKAEAYADELQRGLDAVAASVPAGPRPSVYFEEWDEPMITGIRWVAELVRIAGGDDIFPERAEKSLARDRILADSTEILARAPDIIFGSWCGKKFRPTPSPRARLARAARRARQPAVRDQVRRHPAARPAALTDGLRELPRHIRAWHALQTSASERAAQRASVSKRVRSPLRPAARSWPGLRGLFRRRVALLDALGDALARSRPGGSS